MENAKAKKPSMEKHTEATPLRLRPSEKEGFQRCADYAGISLASWSRERLRWAAIKEYERGDLGPIPFIDEIPLYPEP